MSLTLSQQYLTEHTEPTEKDNLMNPSAASYLLIYGRICHAYVTEPMNVYKETYNLMYVPENSQSTRIPKLLKKDAHYENNDENPLSP